MKTILEKFPLLYIFKKDNHKMKSILLSSTILLVSFIAHSQNQPQDHVGNWVMYFGNHKLSEKYSIHNEAQLRLYEPFSNSNQGFIRLGLNYHINEYSLVTAGYGYFRTESFTKGENKIFLFWEDGDKASTARCARGGSLRSPF